MLHDYMVCYHVVHANDAVNKIHVEATRHQNRDVNYSVTLQSIVGLAK